MTGAEQLAGGEPCILDVPYLLALDVAIYRAPDGSFWTSPSWARDLTGHIAYLPQLTVMGIQLDGPLPDDAVRLPDDTTRYIAVRRGFGRKNFYLSVPRLIWLLLREIPKTRFVHSTLGYGEGVPYGWFAYPLARLFGKKSGCIIEASFWRIFPGEKAGLKRRFEAWASEHINRWIMAHVDYAAYQHEAYRRSLPSPKAGGGVLSQASWIGVSDVVDMAALEARWQARDAAGAVPRALFAARLVLEKGTRILIAAIDRLADAGVDLDVDIVGAGPEREALDGVHGRRIGRGTVRVLDPIAYGAPFFDYLKGFDLLLVPSLGDEQPRIVYDAGAQGVGAIVSDTPGLKSCVVEGESAIVVRRNDPAALADAVVAALGTPGELRRLALGARTHALANTHERMHEERCRDLKAILARD